MPRFEFKEPMATCATLLSRVQFRFGCRATLKRRNGFRPLTKILRHEVGPGVWGLEVSGPDKNCIEIHQHHESFIEKPTPAPCKNTNYKTPLTTHVGALKNSQNQTKPLPMPKQKTLLRKPSTTKPWIFCSASMENKVLKALSVFGRLV